MGTAARRAGEPFVQQFLDKHSRADAAFVCAALPAAPCFFASPRQHDQDSPGRPPPLLASPSPLRLIPPSGHANTFRLFPAGRRLCWRRPPRYTLFLRRATPTQSNFSRPDVAFVGAALPATPYFSVGPRQRSPTFPGRTSPLFAPPSPLRLIPPSGHANTTRILPGGRRLCLRRPPRCALFLRRATPTRSHFSRADAAFVGAALPAAPYSSVGPRQRGPTFPGRTPSLLAPHSPLRLILPSGHANTVWKFPDMLAYWDTRKLKKRDSLQ